MKYAKKYNLVPVTVPYVPVVPSLDPASERYGRYQAELNQIFMDPKLTPEMRNKVVADLLFKMETLLKTEVIQPQVAREEMEKLNHQVNLEKVRFEHWKIDHLTRLYDFLLSPLSRSTFAYQS